MPQMIKLRWYDDWSEDEFGEQHNYAQEAPEAAPVATEEELLEFANKLRAAGNANALEALIPSVPENSSACLIANACNFGASVEPDGDRVEATNEYNAGWFMHFPTNIEPEVMIACAKAVGCNGGLTVEHFCMRLPRHIGNAAHAFDSGQAFKTLVKESVNA